MEVALGIIGTILIAVVGWILTHSSQCSRLRERVATLEEWKRAKEESE